MPKQTRVRTRTELRSLRTDFTLYTEYVSARIQGLTHQLRAAHETHTKSVARIRELEAQLEALQRVQN